MIRSVMLFLAWALVGFVASFALMYGFTPVGPLIFVLTWLAYRHLPRISASRLPEAYGALAGFGAFWLFIATSIDGDASEFFLFGAATVAMSTACYLVGGRRRCAGGLTAA